MDTLLSNFTELLSNTFLDKIKFILLFFSDNFQLSNVVLYIFGTLIKILPDSPLQSMIDIANVNDIQAFDHTLNYINWLIPFDNFTTILSIWIPFVAALYSFRYCWGSLLKFLKGIFIK